MSATPNSAMPPSNSTTPGAIAIWAAVNCVAEVSDNRAGNSIESAAVATLFGDRYQERIRATTVAQRYMTDHADELVGVN